MPKVIGKMSTTDADGVVAYSTAIGMDPSDTSDTLDKHIPQVFYAFNSNKTLLYRTYADMQSNTGISYTTIPVSTIVFISGESKAYIRLTNISGLPNWVSLVGGDAGIFTNLEEAENYAKTIGRVGEIITYIDLENNEVIVYKIDIGNVLSDVATSFLVQLYSTELNTSYTLTSGQSVKIGFVYDEKYGNSSTTKPGEITYQIKRPSDENFVTISGINMVRTIACSTVTDPSDPNYEVGVTYNPVYFDPAEHGYNFETGNNIIQITVTGGDSRKSKSIQYNIRVIDMYVQADTSFNDHTAKNLEIITYPWTCYGEGVEKTVYLDIIDDSTGNKYTITKDIGTKSGAQDYTSINLKTAFPGKSSYHGTYTIEHYCVITSTIGTDNVIKSDSLFFNIMYYETSKLMPLISATCSDDEIDYGDNIYINYAVYTYNPSTEYTNDVTQTIYYYTPKDAQGNIVEDTTEGALQIVSDDTTPNMNQVRLSDTGLELDVGSYVVKVIYDTNETTFRNGATKARWSITDYPDTSKTRVIFLELSCTNTNFTDDPADDETAVKKFMVKMGSISGDYNLSPASVPTFCYFNAAGKSNNSANRASWETTVNGDTGPTARTLTASLSNFNFVNNGWVEDANGTICLRHSGSAKTKIPILIHDTYMYYVNDGDRAEAASPINASGRTIIIDFNIHDVLSYQAQCITLINPSENRGIIVTPQEAYLTNENFKLAYNSTGAISNKDDMPFVQIKDNQRLQLAIVIENMGHTQGTIVQDGGGFKQTQFIRIYLNGELTKALSFESYAFNQATLPSLMIGHEDCVVDVYSVRSYESALKDNQILQNYIADRPTIKDKMAEFDRNAIYSTSGTTISGISMDYEKARRVYPCFLITGELSPIKGNKTKVGIIYTEPAANADGYTTNINCMDYYTKGSDTAAKTYLCETNVQGTSSQIYAKKNYKFKFVKLKTSEYEDVTSYYVKDETDDKIEYYCEFRGFDFNNWYGPGNTEYWEVITESVQNDTYSTKNTYVMGDTVIYAGFQYLCIKNCDFTGDGNPTSCMFVPYITSNDSNILVKNTHVDDEGAEVAYGRRFYFIKAGDTFYYRGDSDSNIANYLISDEERIRATSALVKNDLTDSYSVNIGQHDDIKTSKVKYKLFPPEAGPYMGDSESTICVKADYMSPDGINSDNGRMFPKLFDEPIPPQQYNPIGSENNNCFICIPGFRCLIFRKGVAAGSETEFIGRYNFNYDKSCTKSFGLENDGDEDDIGPIPGTQCQKWEYLDNKDDICNFKSYKLFEPVGNTIAATSALESTYPDQGDLEDAGRTPDYLPMQVMYSWVLQRANFWDASSDNLADPLEYNGVYYYNEKAYRRAIFINEFEKHFNKHHVINYHLCVELMAIVDNRAKNMFMSCYDVNHDTNMFRRLRISGMGTDEAKKQSAVNIKFTSTSIGSVSDIINYNTGDVSYNLIDWENSIFPIWYTSLYDMDSCSGVDNTGHNIYNYDVEIHDIYAYDALGNPTYCFNGEGSTFWCMVEDVFAEDIKARWQALRQTTDGVAKLSLDGLFEEYMTKGADSLPPVVYNEDQRFKYLDILINGYKDVETGEWIYRSEYQYLCQGSKRYHKRWFLENRLAMLDSKYDANAYKGSEITFRINKAGSCTAEEVAVDITPATTQYQRVEYGNANMSYGDKCYAGDTIHIKPAQGGIFQNIVFKVLGASNVSSMGDISHLYPSDITLSAAKKLKELIIGSQVEGYHNQHLVTSYVTNLQLPLLQKIDVSNCEGLTGPMNLSDCRSLREVYAGGTNLSGITLPNGGSLAVLKLPRTVANFQLKNQKYLTSVIFEGYDNLTGIIVEDCGDVQKTGFDVRDIINRATNLKNVRLIGVDLVLDGKDLLNKIMACGGYDANGVETRKAVITGTVRVENVSTVNQEIWLDYWKDYIADGSLRFVFGTSTNFYYSTYVALTGTSDEQVVSGTDDDGNPVQKAEMVSAGSESGLWYCETEADSFGAGHTIDKVAGGALKTHRRPILLSVNGDQPLRNSDGLIVGENNNTVEVKTSTTSSYWCVDGNITSYSPNDYYLALEEYNDNGHIQYINVGGINNHYKRIITHAHWIVNGKSTNVNYPVAGHKAVLRDSNGNIVYTANGTIQALPVDDQTAGNWSIEKNNVFEGIIIDGAIATTDTHKLYIVSYRDIHTEFVDEGDPSRYTLNTLPEDSLKRQFSHWSPIIRSASGNNTIYAHFIDGYNTQSQYNPVPINFIASYEGYEFNQGAPISYKINRINPAFYETGAELVIQKEIEGLPVAALGDDIFTGAFVGNSIKKIYFEVGSKVKHIGARAFAGCTNLDLIEIPDSVTSIGANAFMNCTAKIMWTGNPTIETIGDYAFANYKCPDPMIVNCQPIDIYDKNRTIIYNGRSIPDSVVTIGTRAFESSACPVSWGSGSFTEVIGSYAFNNSAANRFILPNASLIEIGQGAFQGCVNIDRIVIPRTVKRIFGNAFTGCVKLEDVKFAGGIKIEFIGDGPTVFNNTKFAGIHSEPNTHDAARHWQGTAGSKALYVPSENSGVYYLMCAEDTATSIAINSGTLLIAENAFAGIASLKTVTFNQNGATEYINDSAFAGCTGITSAINISDNVVKIGAHVFDGCSSVTNIKLGSSVSEIGEKSFANTTALTTVTLNNNLKKIADYAFYASGITSIKIPDSVEEIGDFAFNKCSNIATFTTPFLGRRPGLSGTYDSVFGYFFGYQINAQDVKVGDNLRGRTIYFDRTVNLHALGSKTLISVDRNLGTEDAPDYVNLMKFEAEENGSQILYKQSTSAASYQVASITSGSAGTCNYSTDNFTFPDDIDYIVTTVSDEFGSFAVYNADYVALRGENNITPTVQYYSPTEYEEYFIPASIKSVILTKVNEIAIGAFSGMLTLQSVTLANAASSPAGSCNVETIGMGAFGGCISLTSIVGLDAMTSLTEIGDGAFYGCTSITSITLPSGTKSIGAKSFENCTSLQTFNIPASLEAMGQDALTGCGALSYYTFGGIHYLGNSGSNFLWAIKAIDKTTSVYEFNETTVGIYYNCLAECKNFERITIPAGVSAIYDGAFMDCERLNTFVANGNFKSDNYGVLYTADYTELVAYPIGRTETSTFNIHENTVKLRPYACYKAKTSAFNIRSVVTSIGYRALYDCEALRTITVGADIVEVEDEMFYNCKNATIFFEAKLTKLGVQSFYNCANLYGIELNAGLTEIPERCFDGCTNLVNNLGTYVGGLVIPSTVEYIGPYAFRGVRSLSFSISFAQGSLLTNIGEHAFAGIELNTMTLAETTESIGVEAFADSALSVIVIPNKVTTIEEGAFIRSESLTKVTLGSEVANIHTKAFSDCTRLSTVNIETQNVPTLEDVDAFANNAYDRLFVVKNGQTDSYVAKENWSTYEIFILDKEDFENGITTIDVSVSNSDLFQIGITKYPTPIDPEADGITATLYKPELTTVIWGDGIYSWTSKCGEYDTERGGILAEDALGIDASGAPYIKGVSVTLYRASYGQTNNAANGNYHHNRHEMGNANYNIRETRNADGNSVTSYAYLTQTPVAGTTYKYYDAATGTIKDGQVHCLYDTDQRTTYTIKIINRGKWKNNGHILGDSTKNSKISKFLLDSYAQTLGVNMLNGATNLTELTLPNLNLNVYTKVEDNFMRGCNNAALTDIILPRSITDIGSYAFSGCKYLKNINIDNVERIDVAAFYGCSALTAVTFNKIMSFGAQAFYACSELDKVVINTPNDIPTVATNTFTG